MAKTIGFNRNSNRGTGVCEHCGKRTWVENIECGYCDRCNQIFGYDNTLADNSPDSEDAKYAVKAIRQALEMPGYPAFPDDEFFNSKVTQQIVDEYIAKGLAFKRPRKKVN